MRETTAQPGVTIARSATDPVAYSGPVTWAIGRLRHALDVRGIPVRIAELSDVEHPDSRTIIVAGAGSPTLAATILRAGLRPPSGRESFALVPSDASRASPAFVCGSDVRGLVYGVLELTDRVEHAGDPGDALELEPTVERPANEVRSVTRLFCSEIEDKVWFHDEAFWHRYLTMLVSQRFNRFSLTLGLGYNYPRGVTDAYLYFAYPFFISVPGYDVRVPQLPKDERERNLQMLRFISEQTVARGLDFQLGLWSHAFEWIDSPDATHTIDGLEPETHAAYCRDAVKMLLQLCPSIGGLTFRIHGESGIPERSWDFWRTMFDGVAGCGRVVGLDLHAKGLDETTLSHALATGLPITVSPKFWAEHLGLPYHQAAIRKSERALRADPSHRSEWHRYMSVSEGSRPFTRYGYGDFLREDRRYDIVFRLWPGTQRLLLWGDPAFAAGYGRAAAIVGSQGLEWCEPLTFKGREGSGTSGSRTGYADPSLVLDDDWGKFEYTYRLFGRLTYDPDAPAETWQRPLRRHFGGAAPDAESALAHASRILPLVTVAHHPSASNNYYWPELYTDMPIVWSTDGTRPHPYVDTPTPRRFGTVSPLDPEIFSSVTDFVQELLAKQPSGRVSPLEVARRLDALADEAARGIGAVEKGVARENVEARRWIVDVGILIALGHFFAEKLRSAVCYELHAETRSQEALRRAIEAYRAARVAWDEATTRAAGVYADDLTFGPQPWLRGQWADRMAAINADLRDMEDRWKEDAKNEFSGENVDVRRLLEEPAPTPDVDVVHVAPEIYEPGKSLPLEVDVHGADRYGLRRVTVRYRPMNHAIEYSELDTERSGERFTARIPAQALHGAYPLAYAFVGHEAGGSAWRHPALGPELAERPYFVVRPA